MEYTLHNGSEGSRIASCNVRKYNAADSLAEHSPMESDKPVAPPSHKLRTASANEVIRRQAARNRDNCRRFSVVNSPLGVESRNSVIEKE